MKRPDLRPMRRLPVLEPKRAALETCVFCPKLCRSACPVSNAEPRETITPWGKMSMAYFVARGDVPLDESHAAPAWACTGCMACRESCDHRNDVTSTLLAARAAQVNAGAIPAAAARVIRQFAAHANATRRAVDRLRGHPAVRFDAPNALLIGCAYTRAAPGVARDAIHAATALVQGPIALIDECCGLPLKLAGADDAFARHAARFARQIAAIRARTILVADAGCALALRVRYPESGGSTLPNVELLVERAAQQLGDLSRASPDEGAEVVRYHDPCQLGRGLGVYDAPRAVLTRALGGPPAEFDDRRERADCSGAGGLLPSTMPGVAQTITGARLDAHERLGGGRIVTACASSLLAMRRQGRAPVDDIVSWIARAARPWRAAT